MPPKRCNDNEADSKPNKIKAKCNLWNKEEITLTPPTTPNSTKNSKFGFNMWRNGAEETAMNISDLKIGFCTRSIQFRVSLKSCKKSTKNGEMFHFHAFDGMEIQVTVFPIEAVKFFDLLSLNRTYKLKNFQVKLESKDFPSGIGNDIYICLNSKSEINVIDDGMVSPLQFEFVNIDTIDSMEINSKCDVLAIIGKDWGQESTSNEKLERDIMLTDKTKECINLTLWGDSCTNMDFSNQLPVIIRNGVISEYSERKYIKCGRTTSIWINPDIAIAGELKKWFDEEFEKLAK